MKGLKHFILLAFLITSFCGLITLSVQQSYRQGANDPQIQMSEDSSNQLSNGLSAETLLPETSPKVDIAKSLDSFLIIYSDKGDVLESSATLNGKTPPIPNGILDLARQKGQLRFTWQPDNGVRIAAVITYFKGQNTGFVLAGRNLREVEIREQSMEMKAAAVWALTVAGTFLLTLLRIY